MHGQLQKTSRLKRRAQSAGVPVIYVNDNFWPVKSDRTVEYCTRRDRGRDVVNLLRPDESDYFVLKPKHSGFFSPSASRAARYLKNAKPYFSPALPGTFCVFFTANDAYMGDYNLFVPSDCTASNTKKENESALRLMKKFLEAGTLPSSRIVFSTMRTRGLGSPSYSRWKNHYGGTKRR